MARRPQLTDEERQLLFGVPGDPDALARHYIFTRSDQDLVLGRRGAANRLGFAVQLALLRTCRFCLLHFACCRNLHVQIRLHAQAIRNTH